jgi:hypothetical protein
LEIYATQDEIPKIYEMVLDTADRALKSADTVPHEAHQLKSNMQMIQFCMTQAMAVGEKIRNLRNGEGPITRLQILELEQLYYPTILFSVRSAVSIGTLTGMSETAGQTMERMARLAVAEARLELPRAGQAILRTKNAQRREKIEAAIRTVSDLSASIAFARKVAPVVKELTGLDITPASLKSGHLIRMRNADKAEKAAKLAKVEIKQLHPK